jgi:hypothetical protein
MAPVDQMASRCPLPSPLWGGWPKRSEGPGGGAGATIVVLAPPAPAPPHKGEGRRKLERQACEPHSAPERLPLIPLTPTRPDPGRGEVRRAS